jgi:spoIIIJ-associated protein
MSMESESIETRGRTAEEAIRAALTRLGVTRDDVEIEVLAEGRAGVFGVGSQEARVRVTVISDYYDDEDENIGNRRDPDEIAVDEDEDDEEEEELQPGVLRPSASVEEYDEDEEEDELQPGALRPSASVEEYDEDEEEEAEEAAVVTAESTELARETLEHMLDLLDFPNIVTVRGVQRDRGKATILLDVAGEDVGLIIGRHGETLSSLQFLLNACLGKRLPRDTRVVIDIEHYRERREQSLKAIAMRAADRARRERHPVTLQPMPPNERRIIHLTLQASRYVSTESTGEGAERRVVITPKQTAPPPPRRPSYGYQRGMR